MKPINNRSIGTALIAVALVSCTPTLCAADESPSEGPSKEETIQWLKANVGHLKNGSTFKSQESEGYTRGSERVTKIEVEGKELTITLEWLMTKGGWLPESRNNSERGTRDIKVKLDSLFAVVTVEPVVTETLQQQAAGNQMTVTQIGKKLKLSGRNVSATEIPVDDEYAERVKKALEHLIKISGGGGKEPF